MDKVYEVEFIGRGGQGAKTAAEIVARAALKNGFFVQSFPDYGPERKGAPVRAFTRTSKSQIRGCSSEANPDVIIILDPTLLTLNGTLFTLSDHQILLVNSDENANTLKSHLGFQGKLFTVDATKIALDVLKVPITNTAMLGALAKVADVITIEEIKEEVKEEFARKLDEETLNKNITLIERAYKEAK